MRKIRFITIGLIVALITMLPALSSAQKKAEAPARLSCSAYNVGSGAYPMLAYFGDAWLEKYGIKLRVIPAGTDMARLIPLRSKEVDFTATGVAAYFAQEGLEEYANRDWGPQEFRYMWLAQHPGFPMAVRATSDIYKLSDLRGKKVPFIPGAASVNIAVTLFLKAGGLTWNDVVRVEVPSYGAAAKAVLSGTVDTCAYNVTGGDMYELEASPYGIRYLSPPAADKEAWKAIKSVIPFYAPSQSTMGAGVSKEKPADTMTYPYPLFLGYAEQLSNDIAYFITKATHEAYPVVSEKDPSGAMKVCWPMEANLRLFESGACWPFHDGSVQYLKEKGLWKDAYEKINQAAIERQKKLKKIWNATIAKADAQKISDKDFSAFWLKERAAALGE